MKVALDAPSSRSRSKRCSAGKRAVNAAQFSQFAAASECRHSVLYVRDLNLRQRRDVEAGALRCEDWPLVAKIIGKSSCLDRPARLRPSCSKAHARVITPPFAVKGAIVARMSLAAVRTGMESEPAAKWPHKFIRF